MRDIIYFDENLSVEEYVKKEVCKNGGTKSIDSICIEYDNKTTKEDLFDLLINNGFTYKKLAESFEVGVSSQVYQKTFNITHQDVKRLERRGILKKVGEYRFRAFGKYNYAPLYDVYQYAEMTDDDMRNMLKEYPRKKTQTL